PQAAGSARRQDDPLRGDVPQPAVVLDLEPDDTSGVDQDPLCSRPGEDPDRRGTTHRADHRAHDLSPGTVASGVDDATTRVGPLQPRPQGAVRGTVEPGT